MFSIAPPYPDPSVYGLGSLEVFGTTWTITALSGGAANVVEDTGLPFVLIDDDTATSPFAVRRWYRLPAKHRRAFGQ